MIKEIKRISKPGRRVYSRATSIPKIQNGLGMAIISTSQGVMSDIQARKNKSFLDLYDFCLRVGCNRVNKRILTTLIGSGAMDSLGKREILFNQINPILKKVEQVSERSHSQMQDFLVMSQMNMKKKNKKHL